MILFLRHGVISALVLLFIAPVPLNAGTPIWQFKLDQIPEVDSNGLRLEKRIKEIALDKPSALLKEASRLLNQEMGPGDFTRDSKKRRLVFLALQAVFKELYAPQLEGDLRFAFLKDIASSGHELVEKDLASAQAYKAELAKRCPQADTAPPGLIPKDKMGISGLTSLAIAGMSGIFMNLAAANAEMEKFLQESTGVIPKGMWGPAMGVALQGASKLMAGGITAAEVPPAVVAVLALSSLTVGIVGGTQLYYATNSDSQSGKWQQGLFRKITTDSEAHYSEERARKELFDPNLNAEKVIASFYMTKWAPAKKSELQCPKPSGKRSRGSSNTTSKRTESPAVPE